MKHGLRAAGLVAGLSFAIAVYAFGAALEGYRQALLPVALLGGDAVPRALYFNLTAFVVPGAIAIWIATTLRGVLPGDTRWSARIGARLVMFAAMAFAAQGLLPLDPADLEAPSTRLHATAWTLWWIAFMPGAALLAVGLRGRAGSRRLASVSMIASLMVLLFAASPWQWLPSGATQRMAYAAWFGWLIACGATVDALRPASRDAI